MPGEEAQTVIEKRPDARGRVILYLAGRLSGACLGRLRRSIAAVRRNSPEVVIDLAEVTLAELPCLQFLAGNPDLKLINCPEYIQPWLRRLEPGG